MNEQAPYLAAAVLAAMALASAGVPAIAQMPIRSERVQFAPGASAKTIRGTLSGYDAVDYLVSARAGQRMSVTLNSSNGANYFNVLPPGSDTAVFIGSSEGSRYTGSLAETGVYRVRVYLMRSAARRGERADYTVMIGVTTGAAAAPARQDGKGPPIAPGNMAAYCRGEVSGMYGTRPTYVKTGPLVRDPGGGMRIDGTVDKGTEGIKRFRCRYGPRGRFIDVMALTPDGE